MTHKSIILKGEKKGYMKSVVNNKSGVIRYLYGYIEGVSMCIPADILIHVVIIFKGNGSYNEVKVKQGDIIAFGFNCEPINLVAEELSAFQIDMTFSQFYSIFGILPLKCKEVIKLLCVNPFIEMKDTLFRYPFHKWVDIIESSFPQLLLNSKIIPDKQIIRVAEATELISVYQSEDLVCIAEDLEISYRQLQRDFIAVLGITPKDYLRIYRFYIALRIIRKKDLTQVAANSGYWDQAHMNRDFKKISGLTPNQVKKRNEDREYDIEFDNISANGYA